MMISETLPPGMDLFNPNPEIPPRVLASDLDGTLLPLAGNPENHADLRRLRLAREASGIGLVFATGRHLESVADAVRDHDLPPPDWIVCDVGTSVFQNTGGRFEPCTPFEAMLAARAGGADRAAVEALLAGMNGLALQPPARQRRFKVSYNSAADEAERLADAVNRRLRAAGMPFQCLASIDPFAGHGLLDVLPAGTSKAAALIWLASHAGFLPDEVVFAGDSGNDLAALTCGFRAIVVANAPAELARTVQATLARRGLAARFFHAPRPATSGVLDGARHFGLIPPTTRTTGSHEEMHPDDRP